MRMYYSKISSYCLKNGPKPDDLSRQLFVVKVILFIEERDPNDATEFDDNEFVSAISEIEYDYDDDEEENEEEDGSSVPKGPLGQFLTRIDPDTPLGQLLNRINTAKARVKTEINLLGRNLRLGLAFLNVG